MKSADTFQKRRLISSYFSVVVSIGLVLFMAGILGLLILKSKKVADHFKEQIAFTVYINDNAKQIEVKQLQKSLQLRNETKAVNFVSKADAAATHARDIGEDFMEFLGYNPLLSSIDVYFYSDFVSPVFLAELKSDFEAKPFVNEVFYDQPLLEILDQNIKKITQGIVALSSVFMLIAILLINSSIRLTIYSKRLLIKTMQLVGATKGFIRRPFIWKHIQLGFLGALFASICLGYLLYTLDGYFPELEILNNPLEAGLVFAVVFAMGILITAISTFFATQRFLNLTTDAVN